MDFREVDGKECMLPSLDEAYLLCITTDLSDQTGHAIPVEHTEFVRERFEEAKYWAHSAIDDMRQDGTLPEMTELAFDFRRHIGVCDKALTDIGTFLLSRPTTEESHEGNLPPPDNAS